MRFGMVDLGFTGNPFTWTNNRQGPATIKKGRRQRSCQLGVGSPLSLLLYLHIPAFSSDHHPILLNTSPSTAFIPRPFKLKIWTKDPSCGQVIDEAWRLLYPEIWFFA
ncbi:hypothetical protein SLA2020_370590 [Shorea laevis]